MGSILEECPGTVHSYVIHLVAKTVNENTSIYPRCSGIG